MGKIKSKQIDDFNNNISGLAGWQAATNQEIASSRDIADHFVPEYAMTVDRFTGQTISSTSAWTLTTSVAVSGNHTALVAIYINGLKLDEDSITSISGTTINVGAIAYDIDTVDIIEVHYVQDH